MLRRYRGKRRKLRFLTYDLEWFPGTMKERLVGVYDGSRYRSYPSTLEFLRNELTHKNRGAVFFAHAGGMADIQFVLAEMIKRSNPYYSLEGHWSGSSLVICSIKAGRNKWVFADSYWLLRDKLSKIGSSLGTEKGGQDYYCSNYPHCGHEKKGKPLCIFYAPDAILRDYNALDCRILYGGIERFQDEVMALGGVLKMTVASTAMMLFRCEFLKRDIPTSQKLNTIARTAYIASRVEVIQRDCEGADYYDINSSFPWSMTKPQPSKLIGSDKRWIEGDGLAMVDAEVSIPPMYIPPVPMRVGTRVYFPTGTFRRWFMGEDLELVLDCGGHINRIHEVLHFEPFSDLAAYVSTIYELRRTTTDSFQRLVYKYLMNSLYGKFGEGNDKTGLLVNPRKKPPASQIKAIYRAGVYQIAKTVEVKHAHVPIAASITASSRALLTRGLQQGARNGRVFYCDTDSIVTTDTFPTGDKLGEWKHEKHVERGTFLAPKLYRLFPGPEIRAKGFRSLDSDEFDALVEGGTVEIERMVRIRENFRNGQFTPRERTYKKRTLGHMSPEELEAHGIRSSLALTPKRRIEKDGSSSPWSYEELLIASEKPPKFSLDDP